MACSLFWKASKEIHESIEGEEEGLKTRVSSFLGAIVQIMLLDIIFSLYLVITAVGLSDHLFIMMAAVVIAVGVMMFAARSIGDFVERHPSVNVALSFLILVGFTLILESFDIHVPKGYIDFAMFFSIAVESQTDSQQKEPALILRTLSCGRAYSLLLPSQFKIFLLSRYITSVYKQTIIIGGPNEDNRMKKWAVIISAVGLAFAVSGCSSDYVMATKDGLMIFDRWKT